MFFYYHCEPQEGGRSLFFALRRRLGVALWLCDTPRCRGSRLKKSGKPEVLLESPGGKGGKA